LISGPILKVLDTQGVA